ncbi:MAG: hypothetical protein ABGX23_06935 [Nautiliaceae bacterium]
MRVSFVLFFLILLSLKRVEYILASLFLLFLIDFKNVYKRLKKVILSVFLFNLGVSIGYLILSFVKGVSPFEYVIYINLKVILMTYFVFWFFSRVDIVKFFSFSKDLSYLLSITLSQIYSYKKTFIDFRDAFRARVVNLKDKEKEFIANTFKFFLKKAFKDSKERSLAMKARGFFDD